MKWLLVVLLFTPTVVCAVKCPSGSSEWQGGCVVDLIPFGAPTVMPSDEKPPSDKMPSYQREGVKLVDAPNCAKEDERMDQEKLNATSEGKRKAGIK